MLSLSEDRVEILPDGRLRIASALRKAGWDASITIGIDGSWYEVESEVREGEPHPWVSRLRPSPSRKNLPPRGTL